jgi:DNA-binding CsgD family transcriptional regulator
MPGYTLDDRHLDRLRDIVDACRIEAPDVALPWEVLRGVGALLGCDEMEFVGLNYGAQSQYFFQSSGDGREDFDTSPDDAAKAVFWQHFRTSTHRPPWIPDRVASVTKPTDFMTENEWRNLPLYVDCLRRGSKTSHELMMSLPDGAGRQLRLLCWRHPGGDFTERERFDLQLLLPHIEAAYRRGEGQRASPRITARQRELLELVGDGYTNQQIGQRMGLSEGTVRTHLNNIYARLGVRSRTEAVIRVLAQPGGSHIGFAEEAGRGRLDAVLGTTTGSLTPVATVTASSTTACASTSKA